MANPRMKLLNSADLKELYRVTNPQLEKKPRLNMVVRHSRSSEWLIEGSSSLKGYRACQIHLEATVKRHLEKGIWPNGCDIGIGIFEGEDLVRVLVAVNLGHKPGMEVNIRAPLDDILGAVDLTRHDID